MSDIQSKSLLSFPTGAYTKPAPEKPDYDALTPSPLSATVAGEKQTQGNSTAIGSIATASPATIAFNQALNDVSPRGLPERIEVTPVVTDRKAFMAQLEKIPYAHSRHSALTSKIVNLGGRPIAIVRIGQVRVPFYASSGQNQKEGVTPGNWYPLLGVSTDGWFNKTPAMKDYYGSPKLKEAAQNLDMFVGDVRDDYEAAPRAQPFSEAIVRDFINRDMSPFPHGQGEPYAPREHVERMAHLIEQGVIPRGAASDDEAETCHIL